LNIGVGVGMPDKRAICTPQLHINEIIRRKLKRISLRFLR
jgi:hypothetical protein